MAKQVQIRRDTTTNLGLNTPAVGELGYDSTRRGMVQGDGSSAGGVPTPNFNEIIEESWRAKTASEVTGVNDIKITIDSRFAWRVSGGVPPNPCFFFFKAPANNTGAVDFTVDWGAGSKKSDLKYVDGSELGEDTLISGKWFLAAWNGTDYQLIGAQPSVPSQWELVERATKTGGTTVEFDSGFETGYEHYFSIRGYRPPSSTSSLGMRVSNDGGSSYLSNSDYQVDGGGATTSFGIFSNTINDTITGGAHADLYIPYPDVSGTGAFLTAWWKGINPTSSTAITSIDRFGLLRSGSVSGPYNAVQFLSLDKDFAAGEFIHYRRLRAGGA